MLFYADDMLGGMPFVVVNLRNTIVYLAQNSKLCNAELSIGGICNGSTSIKNFRFSFHILST